MSWSTFAQIQKRKLLKNNLASGFTLAELMVVVAIVGILAAVAMPNFQSLIQANRIQSAASEFQAGLAMARAEAIRRGGDARVAIVPNAVGGTTAWPNGFTVFFDKTGTANADVAPTADSTNVTILMITGAVNANMTVAPNAATPHIIFNGIGRPINKDGAELPVSFAFKSSATGVTDTVRCVVTSASGRSRTAKYSSSDFSSLTPANKCPTL